MKVGLIDVDSKMPNLALMKIKTFYPKAEWAYPLNYNSFDKIYVSSIFNFSDKSWIPKNCVRGGTGFDIKSKLPREIDECQPDYSIYLNNNVSLQRYSTGCIRDCKFCVVRKKEGTIKPAKPLNLNPNGKWIHLLDNSFFANPEWKESIKHLIRCNQPVSFEGVDIRLLDEEKICYIKKLKIRPRTKYTVKCAWDDPKEDLAPRFQWVGELINPKCFTVYVLIGFQSTVDEDLYRVEKLRGLGFDPFVMPFDKFDSYQAAFARWVNHKAIFNTVKWPEYNRYKISIFN
jgi:hypothetical protein